MSDLPMGAIRLNLSSKALEKRIRRKLGHIGADLHINRPRSAAFKAHGPCHVVISATGQVIYEGLTLSAIGIATLAISVDDVDRSMSTFAIGRLQSEEENADDEFFVTLNRKVAAGPFPTKEEALIERTRLEQAYAAYICSKNYAIEEESQEAASQRDDVVYVSRTLEELAHADA